MKYSEERNLLLSFCVEGDEQHYGQDIVKLLVAEMISLFMIVKII